MKTYVLFLLLFFTCIISSCKEEKAKPVIVPDVNIVTAGQLNVPVYTEYVGQTYGISDVEVQARVDGWITSMSFKEGDMVQQGQLLYTIDEQPTLTRVREAEAHLARASSQLTKTKSDLDRVEPLVQMNALSKRDLDAAVAANKSAQSEVDAAKAALANANIELSYCKVTSPITGIIGISKYQVGDYVNRGKLQGTLNTVSSINTLRVRFPISESEYLRFAKRIRSDSMTVKDISQIPVELLLGDGTIFNEKGKIDLANREVDPETGSLLIQAIFPNPQRLVRPGQYVKVKFRTDEYANAILIPQQAVIQLQSIYQVFMLNDSSKVEPRVIKVGARVGSNWIVTDGLKAGDKIAIIGNALLTPGMTVKPVSKPWDYTTTTSGN